MPFLLAMFLHDKDGQPIYKETIMFMGMTVIYTCSAAITLRPVLLKVLLPLPPAKRTQAGVGIGLVFFVVNVALDLGFLFPMVRHLTCLLCVCMLALLIYLAFSGLSNVHDNRNTGERPRPTTERL